MSTKDDQSQHDSPSDVLGDMGVGQVGCQGWWPTSFALCNVCGDHTCQCESCLEVAYKPGLCCSCERKAAEADGVKGWSWGH